MDFKLATLVQPSLPYPSPGKTLEESTVVPDRKSATQIWLDIDVEVAAQ